MTSFIFRRYFSVLHGTSKTANKFTLPFIELPYRSVEIDLSSNKCSGLNCSTFGDSLRDTLEVLRDRKVSAVYLKADLQSSQFLCSAGALGFRFHHAEGSVAKLLLWLEETPCRVPPFSTHHAGVGAVVVDESTNQILVVKEHASVHSTASWKFPGGLVNLNEEISDACVREVAEETGIKTEFRSVLAVRQSHKIQFGRGDFYFLCWMTPLGNDRTIRVDAEIADACWMDVEAFQRNHTHPLTVHTMAILQALRAARRGQASGESTSARSGEHLRVSDVIRSTREHSDKTFFGFEQVEMSSPLPGRPPFKLYSPLYLLR